MYETNRSKSNGVMDVETVRLEETALRLSQEAFRQGQQAVNGLLAVPSSLALGVAATVTYTTAFLQRGFQMFERSFEQIMHADTVRGRIEGAQRNDEAGVQARS
jgi:hypothetical protein